MAVEIQPFGPEPVESRAIFGEKLPHCPLRQRRFESRMEPEPAARALLIFVNDRFAAARDPRDRAL